MKTIKSVLLGMTLIAGFAVNAQEGVQSKSADKNTLPTEMSPDQKKKNKLTPEQKAEKKAQKMAESLGLSEAQTERVRIIELGIIQKNRGIRENTTYTPEEKKVYLKENRKAKMNMLSSILTPEQMEKYKADMKAKADSKKKK